ncbi:MAG: Na/Pi cotransporter family protein [Acutalibacteraceae bacterium]|nr:Na/Pi cotransporter family protein [Acutalibacteraceae bacterium]
MPLDKTVSDIILALGGLGLFLYGMKLLGNGLELAAGAKLRKILEKITSNRWLGALVGIVVTAIIQSSTAVSVMVVGFVNASLMTLSQAMGVLMGSTIGTTVTSLILSFNIAQYMPVFICIGAFMVSLSKKNNTKYAGQIIAGFGILFFGMSTMSEHLKPLAGSDAFSNMITSISNPMLGILFGIVFAALIQSSSAAVGILQALGAAGALLLPQSVYIIYGIHIGACFTAVISSIGATKDAKRTSLAYVLFTVFGTALFTIITLLTPFTSWIEQLTDNVSLQISLVHIISTIVATLVLLPCVNWITKLTCLIIRGKKEDEEKEPCRLKFVDERILKTPPIAVNQITKEIERMGKLANKSYQLSMEALLQRDDKIVPKVSENEEVIDYLNHSITSYLVQINGLPLEDHDLLKVGSYYHVVSDLERIGDHAENICEIASRIIKNDDTFSEKAIEEIQDLTKLVESVIVDSLDLFFGHSNDPLLLEKISNNEQEIDDKTEMYKDHHIERLSKGECNATIGTLFMELLTNLERIADHSTNIAFAVSPRYA